MCVRIKHNRFPKIGSTDRLTSVSGDNATAYDNLNRLTGFRRGTLIASANNGGVLDTVVQNVVLRSLHE